MGCLSIKQLFISERKPPYIYEVKLYVKNMVCGRCKTAVRRELEKAGLKYRSLELGEVELDGNVPENSLFTFKESIEALGFELIEDKSAREVTSSNVS